VKLPGKSTFITGAGGGIGQALAVAFAKAGANLLITDIRAEALAATEALVRDVGVSVLARAGDLTDAPFVNDLVSKAVQQFGGLDCAVNNAGFYPPDEYLPDLDCALARKVLEVDFWGVFHCMRAQIPAMQARGGGSIVNISSGAGLLGFPRNSIYCAAKHAVVGITRAAALDHSAQGIRINAICPGMIETPPLQAYLADPARRKGAVALHPLGRLGRPHEIADAALWLCSDQASFVTGIALPVDGGFTAQ